MDIKVAAVSNDIEVRGAERRGDISTPSDLAVSPPNNLNGCTSERKLRKKCSIFDEDFFFWSSPEIVEKSVLVLKNTFFWGVFT